jgi:hypothetical protein
MTSTCTGKKTTSPFDRLKNNFFGNPEQSLEQAYQAALTIRSIEDRYYEGERIPLESEEKVVGKFRKSRIQTIISLRFLALLIIIPLLTQSIAKNFLVLPMVEKVRGNEAQVFINAEMKEEALNELRDYEEELKLEHLIHKTPAIAPEIREDKVKEKADELASEFRHKSNSAISNIFADAIIASYKNLSSMLLDNSFRDRQSQTKSFCMSFLCWFAMPKPLKNKW